MRGGQRGLTRRQLLLGGAVAGLGATAAIAADSALRRDGAPEEPPALHGPETVPFHGTHQAGVVVTPQAHSTYVALDLHVDVGRDDLRRILQVLSDDAARLTQGRPALADTEPELATVPARLTVTFGFGPRLVTRVAGEAAVPEWLGPLPAFAVDRLEDRWSGGDLLLEVAADDPVTVSHAVRMLTKDSRSFAAVRWVQEGFRRARGAEPSGTTMRNLFGQVDGTVNLVPGQPDFDRLVWCTDGWLAGGTGMVVRRISMDLDGWDRLDRPGREQSVGRRLGTGAPLTGTAEHDEPDFTATNALGFPVIAEFAHIRRARSENPDERFYRRGYNYETPPGPWGPADAGLVFTTFQADPLAQFVPVQQRLSDLDLLNEWTVPVGSAVFAVPPGCGPDGFVGETLFG